MDLVHIILKMEIDMRVNGSMTCRMEKEKNFILMDLPSQVCGMKTKGMGKDYTQQKKNLINKYGREETSQRA